MNEPVIDLFNNLAGFGTSSNDKKNLVELFLLLLA
jgi:hypothetical protein